MPYVQRTPDGLIASLHIEAPAGTADAEWLEENHPDVQSFIAVFTPPPSGVPDGFTKMDASFVRVLEDVIDTLIIKNIINITDLPIEAQGKLLSRKSFRDRVSNHSLRLFDPSQGNDGIML